MTRRHSAPMTVGSPGGLLEAWAADAGASDDAAALVPLAQQLVENL